MERRVEVRLATLQDAEAIAQVLHNAFVEYRSLYVPERYAATVIEAAQVKVRLEEGPSWIALIEREVVGTVASVSKPSGLYIRGMGVVPEARGLRIGELLMNVVEQYARENRYNRLFLHTTPFRHRAIRLYERCGFRFVEDEENERFGTPLLTMAKALDEIVLK